MMVFFGVECCLLGNCLSQRQPCPKQNKPPNHHLHGQRVIITALGAADMERGAAQRHVHWPSMAHVPKALVLRHNTPYRPFWHARHWRTAPGVRLAALPDRESEPRPLDASKSTAAHMPRSPSPPKPRPPLTVEVLDATESHSDLSSGLVHTTLLLLAFDALCCTDAAHAANIRDFYVNVVYNPGASVSAYCSTHQQPLTTQ